MKSMVASLLEKGVETTFPPSLQWNETSLQPVSATDKGYSSSSIQISVSRKLQYYFIRDTEKGSLFTFKPMTLFVDP